MPKLILKLISLLKNTKNIKAILKAILGMFKTREGFLSFLVDNGYLTKQTLLNYLKKNPEAIISGLQQTISPDRLGKLLSSQPLLSKAKNIGSNVHDKIMDVIGKDYDKLQDKAVKVMTDSNLSLKEKINQLKPNKSQVEALKKSPLTRTAQVINFTATGKSDNVLGTCRYVLTNPNAATGSLTIKFMKKPSGLGFSNKSGTYTYDNVPLIVWQAMVDVTELKPNLNGGKYKWGAMHEFWELYLYAYYSSPKGKISKRKTADKIEATKEIKKAIKDEKYGLPIDYEKLAKIFVKFGETYGNKNYLKKL